MKLDYKEIILWSVLISSLVLLGYFLNPIVEDFSESNEIKITVTDYNNCSNLSFENTTICLVDYVRTFYNYTVRDDIERDLEDIKNNGGDCYDYSILYEKMAKSLGLNATTFSFFGTSGHRFAIIYDYEMTGYCQIDELNYVCRSFK